MANLIRRGNGGASEESQRGELAQQAQLSRDPMRLFREMMRWDPFREMRNWMPSMFGEREEFAPAFEVAEHNDRIVLKADLPGVDEKDVKVNLSGDRLTVSGKRECEHEDKSETYYACERSYGEFSRSFTLPADRIDTEHVTAKLENGVLTIALPKKEPAKSKSIEIKGGEKAAQKS